MLTISQVANRLKVSQETVRRWCRKGTLFGAQRIGGGSWRVPEIALRVPPATTAHENPTKDEDPAELESLDFLE